jgi:hypothetical protein
VIARHDLTETLTNETHWRYAQWIDRDLVYAEAHLWVHAREFLDSDTETGIVREGLKHMRAHCEQLKAKHLGYELDDLCWYSTRHLKDLVAQYVANTEHTQADEGLCDVAYGMRVLPAHHRAAILLYHAGYATDAHYEEAIRELQSVLGGPKPKGLT